MRRIYSTTQKNQPNISASPPPQKKNNMLSEETLRDISIFVSKLLGIISEETMTNINYSLNPKCASFFNNENLNKAKEIFRKVGEEIGVSFEKNEKYFILVWERIVKIDSSYKTNLRNILSEVWNPFLIDIIIETTKKQEEAETKISQELENRTTERLKKELEVIEEEIRRVGDKIRRGEFSRPRPRTRNIPINSQEISIALEHLQNQMFLYKEGVEEEKERLRGEIKKTEAEKKTLEEEKQTLSNEVGYLNEKFERCEMFISKITSQINPEMVNEQIHTEEQNIVEKIFHSIKVLKNEINKYNKRRDEKERSLQKSLQELQTLNQDLQNQLKNLSTNDEESQKLKKDLEGLTLAFGLTSSQLSETQTKLNQLELQSEQNQARLKSYEEEIQGLIKLKTSLESDNQEYEKTNQELKNQLTQNKDKISSLEGERNFLNNNLNRLSGELEITLPETEPKTEQKSIQEKIEFFINYFKQVQTQKEELEEKFQQGTQTSQELRQSLNELEEKLNQSDNSNLQNIQKITNENREVRKKIKDLELELVKERQEVALLNGQLSAEEESLKRAGVKIQIIQKENQVYKNKLGNWQKWALWGVIIGVLIFVGYIVYKKLWG